MGWLGDIAKKAMGELQKLGQKKAVEQLTKVADVTKTSVQRKALADRGFSIDLLRKLTPTQIDQAISGKSQSNINEQFSNAIDTILGKESESGTTTPTWVLPAALGSLVFLIAIFIIKKL